ncbi:unnamed protein product [Trichogramma brassicae]|uniref:Uncharacterized protein n=1 Tax=Trichogramma brassicae TaxID=86971 RepID=A0A6H5J1I7_9HYME|nr:unnamed protein product [Trichogramma brassicae]
MPAMCDHAADGSEKGDTTIDDGILNELNSLCAREGCEAPRHDERERKMEYRAAWAAAEPWVQILARAIGFFRLPFGGMGTHVLRLSRGGFFPGGWRRRRAAFLTVTTTATKTTTTTTTTTTTAITKEAHRGERIPQRIDAKDTPRLSTSRINDTKFSDETIARLCERELEQFEERRREKNLRDVCQLRQALYHQSNM